MAESSIRALILSIAQSQHGGGDEEINQTEALLNESYAREELSGDLGLEVVEECNSAQTYISLFPILTKAFLLQTEGGEIKQGLALSLCTLLLKQATNETVISAQSSLQQVKSSIDDELSGADISIRDASVDAFMNVANAPVTPTNHGLYIPALLLARHVRKGGGYPDEKVGSDGEVVNWDKDATDLFGRRFFALGGGGKPATATHVRFGKGLLERLSQADMDGPMNRPLRFKLMQDPEATVETLTEFVSVLAEFKKVHIVDKHLEGATNIVGSCVRLLASNKENATPTVTKFFVALLKVHPIKADVIFSKLTKEVSGTSGCDHAGPYICLTTLGEEFPNFNIPGGTDNSLISDVITALTNARDRQNATTAAPICDATSQALSVWCDLQGEEAPLPASAAAAAAPAKPRSGVNVLDDDAKAKSHARNPAAVRPGAQQVRNRPGPKGGRGHPGKGGPPGKGMRPAGHTHVVASQSTQRDPLLAKTVEAAPLVPRNTAAAMQKKNEMDHDPNHEGLAVAVAVADAPPPEYDPVYAEEWEETPPLYKNRQFLFCAGGCFLIVVIIAIVSGVYGTKKVVEMGIETNEPTGAPTAPPTTIRDTIGIREKIAAISPQSTVRDGVHFQAMNWLINFDPRELEPSDPDLFQRYVLALLYFSTNGYAWKECRWDPEEDMCTYTEVGVVKRTLTEARYLSTHHECEWYGIVCNKQKMVREILHQGNNLVGKLPSELSQLPYLRRLWVNGNGISGTIPTEFGNILHMADLQLHGNRMTGTIPNEIFDCSSLQRLSLGINRLTGTIPTRFGELLDLKGLFLFGNRLNGTIPEEIGNLRHLAFVWAHNNTLTGSLPSTLGKLNYLKTLSLSFNTLTGSIPPELGQLQNLEVAIIEQNKLSGSIPDEIYGLSRLKRLVLNSNLLTGTLSEKVGQLTHLHALLIKNNKFTGNIPDSFGALSGVEYLHFHFNEFTGSMPDSVCNSGWDKLNLYADCLDEFGSQQMECDCCTDCCDPMQKMCKKV